MRNELKEISEILAEINDKDFIIRFLQQILTEAEAKDLALRWETVKLIHQRIPQRDIAKKLGVSLCKITRGSKELQKPNNTFLKILNNT